MGESEKVEFFELAHGLDKITEGVIDGAEFYIKETANNGVINFSLYVLNTRKNEETLVAYCQQYEVLELYLNEKIDLIKTTIKSMTHLKANIPD